MRRIYYKDKLLSALFAYCLVIARPLVYPSKITIKSFGVEAGLRPIGYPFNVCARSGWTARRMFLILQIARPQMQIFEDDDLH